MPNLEIDRCTVIIDTTPPVRHYGWVAHDVATFYSLPFRSAGERDRFVRLLADHVATTVAASEVDVLAALLCLARAPDEAAHSAAAACLEREFAALLSAEPLGELDDAVDGLLEAARGELDDADEGEDTGDMQGGGRTDE